MSKRDGYKPALIAVIDGQARREFAWGTDDCLMRAAEAVAVVLDDPAKVTDVVAKYRGRYKTLAGSYRILKRDGFDGPLDLVASLFTEIHHSEAVDGDIGAKFEDGHWGFGVICDAFFHVTTQNGAGILPRSHSQKTFRVE